MKALGLLVWIIVLSFPVQAKSARNRTLPSPLSLKWELLAQMDSKAGKASVELEKMEGKRVRIAGFMVPFDFNEREEVSEFLLTPSVPGCLHVPPPGPNQTVLVKMKKGKAPVSSSPIWVEGPIKVLRSPKTGFGEASFEMTGIKTEAFKGAHSADHMEVLPATAESSGSLSAEKAAQP